MTAMMFCLLTAFLVYITLTGKNIFKNIYFISRHWLYIYEVYICLNLGSGIVKATCDANATPESNLYWCDG